MLLVGKNEAHAIDRLEPIGWPDGQRHVGRASKVALSGKSLIGQGELAEGRGGDFSRQFAQRFSIAAEHQRGKLSTHDRMIASLKVRQSNSRQPWRGYSHGVYIGQSRPIAGVPASDYTIGMLSLTPNESRVLGVLIEKAHATPQQYPMSLNALTAGCNQKNNREPVLSLSEEQVMEAIEGLREKDLVREVMLSGSRVDKFRHIARDTLGVDTNQLVILAELLLRGPQTVGELRCRASRMHPLESVEIVKHVLESLMNRGEDQAALVRELPPAPGDRSPRYAQLLCPSLHPLDAAPVASRNAGEIDRAVDRELEARIAALEKEVARLRTVIEHLAHATHRPGAMTGVD